MMEWEIEIRLKWVESGVKQMGSEDIFLGFVLDDLLPHFVVEAEWQDWIEVNALDVAAVVDYLAVSVAALTQHKQLVTAISHRPREA